MPRNITITFADGTSHVYQNAPDDVTPDQAQARAEKEFGKSVTALDGGRGAPKTGADLIPGGGVAAPVKAPDPAADKGGLADTLRSGLRSVAPVLSTILERPSIAAGTLIESPAAVLSSMAGGVAGGAAGLVKSLTGGKYGTAEGVREGQKTAEGVAQAITYQPRTTTGNALVQAIGRAANESGIMGVAPMTGELAALGRAAPAAKNALADALGAGRGAMAEAGIAGGNALANLIKPAQPAMRGGGAAVTEEATLRAMRAADLPVPIKLTKGQAQRTFEQQRFERETAKLPEGEPLRARFAEQNKQMIDNFDSFLDQTGAQQTSLRGTGEAVAGALGTKRAAVKAEINRAYNAARDAGDMAEPVSIAPLQAYIEQNRSAMKNAPVLAAVEDEIARLSQGKSTISLNEMEELRKMTGRLAQPGTPNAVYGSDVKGLIDVVTKDKGGPQYQQARRMYENYANEFKDKAVIDKLLRNKPGTKDRAVAYEDVFNHSIMKGSLDDVRSMRRTLQTAGPEGAQAWRELQGQTINHIKETITSNVARDINGNPIVSPDKLNKLVRELDADGKLDFIFGKKGAERIRDVNDLAKDVYTAPPGSVNTSNTTSALLAALDLSTSAFTGLPLPIATTINYGVKRAKTSALNKQVENALAGMVNQP